ncbi:MAG TPA: SBBP repeat-containing protein, partial [Chitinophagaceae bacterium]|nr:SBBP repeat-containing protein [Chitinophagaceae bacterium]
STSFNLAFRKAFGGTSDDEPGHHSIVKTPDGGTIILGTTNSNDGDVSGNHGGYDAWLLKLNSAGEKQWSKTYGGSGDDRAASVIVTSDGFLEVTGYTYSHDGDVTNNHGGPGSDLWVMKLNQNGELVWSKAFGGSFNEAGRTIVATPDGGSAIAGFATSVDGDVHGNHGDGDVWVLRLNGQGDTLWTASYGGSFWEEGSNITLSPDGGFALTGLTFSNDGDVSGFHTSAILGADIWVVKLNSNGHKIWAKTLGGSADDVGQAIVASPGGGYIVTAYAQSNDGDISGHHGNLLFNDIWVIKLDDNGNKIWARTYGGNLDDAPTAIIAAPEGGFILVGGTDSHDGDLPGAQGGDYNMCVLKFDDNGSVQWSKKLGGSDDDTFFSIAMDTDGGLLLLGSTNSNDGDIAGTGYHGEYDLWLARVLVQ